ncbi:MAG: methylated-DNA-[protein]-cysteine S-methyltransferase [Micromonosporaceae bacterium]|nr:methylated-DNA-[protein]-cysteine S-methyltransferase [Micromonosporaceae bacterium]
MNTYWSSVDTPVGPFTVLAADDAVLASGWTAEPGVLTALVHPRLRPPTPPRRRADLGQFTKAVSAYLDGDLAAIDDVPVRQRSGEFLEHAWAVLREVRGQITYTGFAELTGRSAAVRAAAQACARNAAALFVPCHRVLRTDGSLGGFRWGLPAKRWLLDHERPVIHS